MWCWYWLHKILYNNYKDKYKLYISSLEWIDWIVFDSDPLEESIRIRETLLAECKNYSMALEIDAVYCYMRYLES